MARTILWLLTLVAPVVLMPARAEPFDYRGIRLGVSLEEFRRIQLAETAGARVVCALDEEARDLRPTPYNAASTEEALAGVIGCGYFRFGRILPSSSLPPEWLDVKLTEAGTEVIPTFWFVPEGTDGRVRRLFRITLHSNVVYWDRFLYEYTRRYGNPAETTRSVYSAGPGGRLDNIVVTWTSADSTIVLTKRAERATQMMVQYLHKELAQRAAERVAAVRSRG